MCEVGISPELRRSLWPLLLSARAPLEPTAAAYRLLRGAAMGRAAAHEHEEARHTALIEGDLARTFPKLGYFAERGGMMRASLLELLLVYCALPDGLPYRQGMSHLAATLLLHVHEPHLACACLNALLTGYPVLRACASLQFGPVLRYFDVTLEQQLPAVHLHLRRHEISSDVYLVRWLLTMFSQVSDQPQHTRPTRLTRH